MWEYWFRNALNRVTKLVKKKEVVSDMGVLSRHFNRSEFECKCGCGYNNINMELIDVLEDVRSHFYSPVIVNSGCRCPSHNKAIGGRKHSKHLLCMAADINVKGISPEEVQAYLQKKYPDKYGIGSYNTFTHIDVRSKKTRWAG